MRNVLLVDGNPDHIRLLAGLFKYRLEPDLEVVGDCVSGLRQIYTHTPDVVLVNALLYASEDYGFPRAMAEGEIHDGIGVVVLVSGKLDEIRERAVKQFRATIVELPTTADELNEAMQKAQRQVGSSTTPRPVTWQPADQTETNPAEAAEQQTVHRVSWETFDKTEDNQQVRPVNWVVDGAGTTDETPIPSKPDPKAARRTRRPQAPRKAPRSDHVVKEDEGAFPPAFASGGGGFKPISRPEKSEAIPEEEGPQPFRPGSTKGLPDVDPKKVKNS